MKNFLALLEKYLPLVIVGVHAAATVPNASNLDKKAVVLATITGVTDAVVGASADPTVQTVGTMIDIAASIINKLTTKTAAANTVSVQTAAA